MELKSSISIHDNTDENILSIKINGNTIENEHDLYVATVYNSPENSSYNINNENNDIFIKLQNKIATFSESDLLTSVLEQASWQTAYMKTNMI